VTQRNTHSHDFNFVFMLTRRDRTVPDAEDHLETALKEGIGHIGFKDVGLSIDVVGRLNERIKASGATSYLEVVSLDKDSEVASAEAAKAIGVDYLLGGTHVDAVLPVLSRTSIRYFPFPGQVVGHPSKLDGSVGAILDSALDLARRPGVHGLDLLAYRATADVRAILRAVCAAVELPVLVAGSIDTQERIRAVYEAGARAFTIGTAALDGAFSADGRDLAAQLRAIKRATNNAMEATRVTAG